MKLVTSKANFSGPICHKVHSDHIHSDSDESTYYDPVEHIDSMLSQFEYSFEYIERAYEMAVTIRANLALGMTSGKRKHCGDSSAYKGEYDSYSPNVKASASTPK